MNIFIIMYNFINKYFLELNLNELIWLIFFKINLYMIIIIINMIIIIIYIKIFMIIKFRLVK